VDETLALKWRIPARTRDHEARAEAIARQLRAHLG
jgi:hypothetical protein